MLLVLMALGTADCNLVPLEGHSDLRADSQSVAMTVDAAPGDGRAVMDLVSACANGRRDNGETDLDCGGPCSSCPENARCSWAGDCRKGVCVEGRCASQRFVERARLPTSFNSAVAADVTGDGLRDVVLGMSHEDYRILERIKGGGFRLGGRSPYGNDTPSTVAICLGDVTGDGKLDMVAGSPWAPEVFVLAGSGLGHFVPFSQHRVTALPGSERSVSCGDFDGDGDVDVAVGGDVGAVVILRNQGKGNLTVQFNTLPIGGAVGPAADFDGDGVADLAVEDLLFTRRLSVKASCKRKTYGGVLVGDFNGDGRLDLGAATEICLGDGRGGLTPSRPVTGPLRAGQRFDSACAGDLNGDGRTDLIRTIRTMPSQFSVDVAPGQASGNLVYSWSLLAEGIPAGLGAVRALSETRNDLLYSFYPPDTFELRILTFN